ncbi:hypothetical protein ABI214_14020 [Prescottella soli]|uniref:Lipase n=1 Tax=Prescottella soli TaxID=1543852 RepID=A0ABW9FX23_9NOCA
MLSPTTGNAAPTYPVPYYLFVQDEFTNPGGSAAGSNDWSCRPSVEHPNPVVLVHGTGANRLNMGTTFAPLLANEGYCVFALTYGNYADQPYPINAIGGDGVRGGQRRTGRCFRRRGPRGDRGRTGRHPRRLAGLVPTTS